MPTPMTDETLNSAVTQHMRGDFARIDYRHSVGQALSSIRATPPTGRIIYFYAVDEEGKLQGVVPTRRLLLHPLEKPIAEIMVKQVVAIPASATVLDACEFFTLHRLLAFPVVDADRRVIGIVDVDLYTEEISELEETPKGDDLFQLIGVHLTSARLNSSTAAFRSRFPWLACNLTSGILAAFLTRIFEEDLKQVVSLVLFIPLVLALAEGVSIQSVSLALEAIHGQRPQWKSLLRRFRREAEVGIMLGVLCGLIVAVVGLVWIGGMRLALCLFIAIAGGVFCAGLLGFLFPNLLHVFKRNAQVAAGPIALAVSDMMTLLIYFSLARWLL